MTITLEQLYQEVVLEHYKLKIGYGELIENPDGKSYQVNPTCGDEITLTLEIHNNIVSKIIWNGVGCSISQASASLMTQLVINKPAIEILELINLFTNMLHSQGTKISEDILDLLEDASVLHGVSKYPARIKCALLSWMALKDGLIQAISE